MTNFRRTMWITVLFLALLAPFVIVLAMALRNPPPSPAAVQAAQSQAAQDGPGLGSLLIHPPMAAASAAGTDAPLLVAGDGKTLWVVHPVMTGKDKKTPAYEMLARSSNNGNWSQAVVEGDGYFNGFPQSLAVIPPAVQGAGRQATAYVFNGGGVARFTLSEESLVNPLPKGHKILATAGGQGSAEEMFAVTAGPADPSTTRPGDRLVLTTAPAASMAAAAGPATGPASAPATTSAPAAPMLVNAYRFLNGHWAMLPALGRLGGEDVPSEQAHTAMAHAGGRLLLSWVEPTKPDVLVVRALATGKPGAGWSKAVTSRLPEGIPQRSRLLAVTLDQTLYLFWPVVSETSVTMHGGWVTTNESLPADLTMSPKNMLPAMNLGSAAEGQGAEDVGIGPTENSLAVVMQGKGGVLTCEVFDDHGHALTKAKAVEPRTLTHDVQISQNIAMLVLFLMLALSLWQWRQRPMKLALPNGSVIAPLYLRACGFLIDIGIPFLIVTGFVGGTDLDSYGTIFSTWMSSFTNPDELFTTPALLYIMGVYLVHVIIGEMFFRRSIGKALLGMQVLMLDGRAPTVLAVLVRNLVRIPEMLPGVLILYILISEHHQRLGDLFARTLVVSQQTPVTPEDPDAKEKSADAEETLSAGGRNRSQ